MIQGGAYQVSDLLIIATAFLAVLTIVCGYYAVKFGLVILKLEDVIENSIDALEESGSVLTKISEKPVFFDSVEIRQCINEITKARNTVMNIAYTLASIDKNLNEEKVIEQYNRKEEDN